MAHKTDGSIIPDALKNFDSLPDAANVRISVAQGLFSCSSATIWRMVNRGKLTPRKLSQRVTAFNVGELRKVMAGASK